MAAAVNFSLINIGAPKQEALKRNRIGCVGGCVDGVALTGTKSVFSV